MASLRNSLQLRTSQTQTLTMTPQLQQAIRFLQLSTLELRQEIQTTVETNPLLEIDESVANTNVDSLDEIAEKELENSDVETFDPFDDDHALQGSDIQLAGIGDNGDEIKSTVDFFKENNSAKENTESTHFAKERHSQEEQQDDDYIADIESASPDEYIISEINNSIPDDLKEKLNANKYDDDSYPDRIVEQDMDVGVGVSNSSDNLNREDNYSAKSVTKGIMFDNDNVYEGETAFNLRDHLTWQLDCSPLVGKDRIIAETIIEAIDDSGYLTESLENILKVVSTSYPETDLDEILVILKLIQSYEPTGVGARTVQECLLLQLKALEAKNPSLVVEQAIDVITNHISLLSNHDYRSLCVQLGIKLDDLKKVNDVIVSLNPRPGFSAVKEKIDFIVPDVLTIKDKNGNYDVALNPESLPKIKLNEQYKALVCYARDEREKEFFKSNLQEANWFIQSIAKRNETLLKVAKCIVQHQKAFLDYGEHRMEPLVLNDIAQEIGMHESTISRVTTEKYLYTSRGTFELKYFFSSHVSTESGGTASSTAIRAEIKAIVANENPRRPYSDNQIVSLLKEKGFCVARRTIAKYREALGIGSSSQRKRLV